MIRDLGFARSYRFGFVGICPEISRCCGLFTDLRTLIVCTDATYNLLNWRRLDSWDGVELGNIGKRSLTQSNDASLGCATLVTLLLSEIFSSLLFVAAAQSNFEIKFLS